MKVGGYLEYARLAFPAIMKFYSCSYFELRNMPVTELVKMIISYVQVQYHERMEYAKIKKNSR